MKINSQYLYELLPAYYRVLDAQEGGPLKALTEILAREGGIVEEHIEQLYDNWFIETCEDWVVPYIGDLLGVQPIHEVEAAQVYSRRAYVANTLSYRRRKGTAPVLEQLALDVTGWRARAVEFFQLLATTQHLQHLRRHHTATPDLRKLNALDLIDTPFDRQSHTVDVRRTAPGQGKYNIPNIGIYLWRLSSYPLEGVPAKKQEPTAAIPDGCYTFSPLGLDTTLFNRPQTETDITQLAEEIHVPAPLRKRALHDELEAGRAAIAAGQPVRWQYFATAYPPVFELYIDDDTAPIPPEAIAICNLEQWRRPPTGKDYPQAVGDAPTAELTLPIRVAVDPELGRMAFTDPLPAKVRTNFCYGFSGDLGGGPYDRQASLAEIAKLDFDWQAGLSQSHTGTPEAPIYDTLEAALADWAAHPERRSGLITIMDNQTYEAPSGDVWEITLDTGQQLVIVAADWPLTGQSDGTPGQAHRLRGSFRPEDRRPHLRGNIEVVGTAAAEDPNGGALLLNGLLLAGTVTIKAGNLRSCSIQHSTLLPQAGGLATATQHHVFHLELDRSISGPVQVEADDAVVVLKDSIIDARGGAALAVTSGQLSLQNCTILGTTAAQTLEASNCLFGDTVTVTRRQTGCVRFSYLPPASATPRRYRCQPELEIQARIKAAGDPDPTEKAAIKEQVSRWLLPVFTSVSYGHEAYAQLGSATPEAIYTGADNGAEMGAFNFLQQAQREANLRVVLREYVPLGLEASLIYMT